MRLFRLFALCCALISVVPAGVAQAHGRGGGHWGGGGHSHARGGHGGYRGGGHWGGRSYGYRYHYAPRAYFGVGRALPHYRYAGPRLVWHAYVGPHAWTAPRWGRGFWRWGGAGWIWIEGPWWVTPAYPNWIWIAPQWIWDGARWVWQEGYWSRSG